MASTLALACALLLILPAAAQKISSLSFPSFPSNSCEPGGPLRCMQNSSVVDGYIALIPEPVNGTDPTQMENKVSRVLFHRPAITWPASFDTNFTVLIHRNANSSNFGDGMAFLMTAEMSPSPQGSFGGLLGLFNRSSLGNARGQLAVQIDTFGNEWETMGDFHVAVATEYLVPVSSAVLNASNVDLTKQKNITFRVRYDGWTKYLEVLAGYAEEGSLVSLLKYKIVIAEKIKPNPVYVGFSAASGPSANYSQSIRVLSWNFTYTPLPWYSLEKPRAKTLKIVLPTVLLGVSLLGLLVFLVVRRVKKWRRRKWLESL